MSTEQEKLEHLIRHITAVQQNARIIGRKILDTNPFVARYLISQSMSHDTSKFFGKEWNYLTGVEVNKDDKEEMAKLKMAITSHNTNPFNKHHPEAWVGGIHQMDDVSLAEMACDIKARSSDFGTSITEWIDVVATQRYGFDKGDHCYTILMKYINMLIEKPFK